MWKWCPTMKHFGLDEVALLISMEVVKQSVSVIDVTKKTIEFRNFQNAKVPLEAVAGHLTMDLKPKHASTLPKQLTPQVWEQARRSRIMSPCRHTARGL